MKPKPKPRRAEAYPRELDEPRRFEEEDPGTAELLYRLGRWPNRFMINWKFTQQRTTQGVAIFLHDNYHFHAGRPKQPGRNERCGCGSGVKFKNCCMPMIAPFRVECWEFRFVHGKTETPH